MAATAAATAATIDLDTAPTHPRRQLTRTVSRPRRHAGAAALLIGLLALAACSPAPAPTAGSAGSSNGSVAAAAPDATGAPPGIASAASPDAAGRLGAAFAAMADGYTSTITVGTATASTAKGRSVGGSSEFVLSSGGKSVTYRAVPPKAWIQQGAGAWVVVSGKVPSGSPIAGLTSPATVTVIADGADGLALDASYPPAALGLAGDKAVRVHLVVAPTGAVTATFETTVGTEPAASTSAFSPASGLSPITAPSP